MPKARAAMKPPLRPGESIEVVGARTNTLAGIDVAIPKRALTVVVGRSGTGKSSLVIDTIAAEAQRRMNATYPAFLQSLMDPLPRPDVDELRHLGPAVVLDQVPLAGSGRSTVGTVSDAWTLMRALYHRVGRPAVASASHLSFNAPEGMCPTCQGTGRATVVDLAAVLDEKLSLQSGALTFPNFAANSLFWSVYANSGLFDLDKPIRKYTAAQREALLSGDGASVSKVNTGSYNLAYEGYLTKLRRLYFSKDPATLKPHVRRAVESAVTMGTCTDCAGSRLSAAARACTVAGLDIATAHASPIRDLLGWSESRAPKASGASTPLLTALAKILKTMDAVGLGHLSLDRPVTTLSRGEGQRLKMAGLLGAPMSDVVYVLDEPTAGLHPDDRAKLIPLIAGLRDAGNTVLVVEHALDVAAAADHVIETGPVPGPSGGKVVYAGPFADLRSQETDTGRLLRAKPRQAGAPREPRGWISIEGAKANNLSGFDLEIPQGVLTVITGVSGSGKTSLLALSWPTDVPRVLIDQSPIAGSRRSTVATWTGVMDEIRERFATANKVKASLFSANAQGACTACAGLGVTYTDLAHLGAVSSPCAQCDGRRFTPDVLRYKWLGLDIADLLTMTIERAVSHIGGDKTLIPMLTRLQRVGLGYLALGQPLMTLSGGERQRLRLAGALDVRGPVICLDEPTTGLHPTDVDELTTLLNEVVAAGATVVVADHHTTLLAHCDWVVSLGPGAGPDGGRLLSSGPRGGDGVASPRRLRKR